MYMSCKFSENPKPRHHSQLWWNRRRLRYGGVWHITALAWSAWLCNENEVLERWTICICWKISSTMSGSSVIFPWLSAWIFAKFLDMSYMDLAIVFVSKEAKHSPSSSFSPDLLSARITNWACKKIRLGSFLPVNGSAIKCLKIGIIHGNSALTRTRRTAHAHQERLRKSPQDKEDSRASGKGQLSQGDWKIQKSA